MTNDHGEKVCAHPACSCLMQEEEDYCSDFCETAREDVDCDCDHLVCTSKAERASDEG